jgi:hypothetical protein
MTLISLAMFQLAKKRTLESFDKDDYMNNNYTIFYMAILLLITAIPAVLVAVNCNKDKPILYGIVAFVFSDLYLLQWSIKKFIIRYPNYCLL